MSKMDIKLGDRIVCITSMGGNNVIGMQGFIKAIPSVDYGYYAIQFDENRAYFHNCDGSTKMGHGFYMFRNCFKVVPKLKFKVVQKSNNK